MYSIVLTINTQSQVLKTLKQRALENIVGKGENACNQHFLLFPQCFLLLSQTEIIILATSILSSANALNLVRIKTLAFGKKFRYNIFHMF